MKNPSYFCDIPMLLFFLLASLYLIRAYTYSLKYKRSFLTPVEKLGLFTIQLFKGKSTTKQLADKYFNNPIIVKKRTKYALIGAIEMILFVFVWVLKIIFKW